MGSVPAYGGVSSDRCVCLQFVGENGENTVDVLAAHILCNLSPDLYPYFHPRMKQMEGGSISQYYPRSHLDRLQLLPEAVNIVQGIPARQRGRRHGRN